jgi:hypothetical protein
MKTDEHGCALDDYLSNPTTYATAFEACELFVQVKVRGSRNQPDQRVFFTQHMLQNLMRYSIEHGMHI